MQGTNESAASLLGVVLFVSNDMLCFVMSLSRAQAVCAMDDSYLRQNGN